MKYLNLLALLLIVSSEQVFCPENSVKGEVACTKEVDLVCGYYLTGELPETFSNPCFACKTEGIASYELGVCDENIPRELEAAQLTSTNENSTSSSGTSSPTVSNTVYICNIPKTDNPICPAIYKPTCGLFNQNIQCIKAPCGKVYGNECEACSDKNVDQYFYGDCTEVPEQLPENPPADDPNQDYHKCTEPRPEICTLEYTSTCGFTEYPCLSESCLKTFGNSCGACSDKSVVGYIFKECSDYAKIWQKPSNQNDNSSSTSTIFKCAMTQSENQFCPEIYRKTCGLFNQSIQCFKAPCGQVYSNECFACLDKKVDSYFFGDCNSTPTENPPQDPSDTDYVKCSDPRPDLCATDEYVDTCAFTEFPCYSESCMKSQTNTCLACQDKTVTGYIKESCKQYQLIYTQYQSQNSTDTKQESKTDEPQTEEQLLTYNCDINRPTSCDQTVNEVCVQYTCQDSTCYKEYQNKCLACQDASTKSYNLGKCLTMNAIILGFASLIVLIL